MRKSQEIRKTIVVAALAIVVGATAGSVRAQAPGRGGPVLPPSVSKRGNKQIASSALNFLGFRVGFSASAFGPISFSEAAAKADALGTGFLEASSSQKVSPENPKNLDYNLSSGEVTEVKHRLDELRLRLVAYRAPIPADEGSRRKLFAFAKAVDIEMIVTSAAPEGLPALDKLTGEFGVKVAFEGPNSQNLVSSLNGVSSRIGLNVDPAAWAKAGIKPADGLRLVNDRLLGLSLTDAGTGTDQLLLELAKLNPPSAPPPVTCGDCAGPKVPVRPLFITIAASDAAAQAFEKAARPAEGYQIIQISKKTPISDGHPGPAPSAGSPNLSDGGIPVLDRWMIRDASPRQALVAPKKARKLLILDLCPQGGFYHRTIPYANLALEYMAKNTGAFEAVFDNDLDNLKYPKIKEYDAVFLNSLVGSVFTDQDVINGLIRFVREGGGVAAIHGTTFASTDVPEFGELLGATTAPHRALEPAMLKIDDPDSPIMKQFEGHSIAWIDELYHFPPSGPYSRDKLHVLMSIDIARSGPPAPNLAVRPDNDYGLVWIRSYGNGRVFNCALGHSVLLFGTPQTAQMILNAIQYVLGDLEADATPSAKLTTKK
jgi:hypothetical protein